MTSRAWVLTALILLSSLFFYNEAGGQRDPVGGAVFNVMSFNATPGTREESTMALIQAWNAACNSPEKATVLIPPGVYKVGETIFQGPCKNPVTILVQGTVRAVADISAYSGTGWISFVHIDGLLMTGGGTFDGRGQAVWKYNDCRENPDCSRLPPSIYLENVNHTDIQQINLVDAMGFHVHVTQSDDVRLQELTVTAPENSPNTDSLNIIKSNMIVVSKSVFKTGGDCISVGHGSTNVTVEQITCGPGRGISIGSLGKLPDELEDVRGIAVKNCTLIGTANGLAIETYAASGPSTAAGILFQDIVLDNVDNPIIIDQNYGSKSAPNLQPSLVKISDVTYQNITGTTKSEIAVSLVCSKKFPCDNVHFHDINLQSKGTDKLKSECSSAKVKFRGAQNPPPCVGK